MLCLCPPKHLYGEGSGTPLQYSFLEDPMNGWSRQAAVQGVAKSRARLSNFTFTFHFHAMEKEMATHSSVLAWRIPGTGEPGGLPSMGSHRVGHDWSDLAVAVKFIALWQEWKWKKAFWQERKTRLWIVLSDALYTLEHFQEGKMSISFPNRL